jgi:hypothetical protein
MPGSAAEPVHHRAYGAVKVHLSAGRRPPSLSITEEVRYEELDDAEHYAAPCPSGSDGGSCAPGRGQAATATVGVRRRIRADYCEDTRPPGPTGPCR